MVSLSPSSTPSVLGYQGSGDGTEALSSMPSITTPGAELGQKWGCWWLWNCTLGSLQNCQGTIKHVSQGFLHPEFPVRGHAGVKQGVGKWYRGEERQCRDEFGIGETVKGESGAGKIVQG